MKGYTRIASSSNRTDGFAFLLLVDDLASLGQRVSVVVLIQFAWMVELPIHVPQVVSDPRVVAIARHFDRAVVAVTFTFLFIVWRRLRAADEQPIVVAVAKSPATG